MYMYLNVTYTHTLYIQRTHTVCTCTCSIALTIPALVSIGAKDLTETISGSQDIVQPTHKCYKADYDIIHII